MRLFLVMLIYLSLLIPKIAFSENNLSITQTQSQAIINNEMKIELVKSAIEARKKAYAPYSNYLVGAALLSETNEIITGSNVENASYGLTVCAERTAIFKNITTGKNTIKAIAVVTKNGGFPCGACRQVMNEFNPKMLVIVADENGKIHSEIMLNELLPNAFGPENL